MGIFDRNSIVSLEIKSFSKNLKSQIELRFNTKVYDYGVVSKGTKDFTDMRPLGIMPPKDSNYIFYYVIPVDEYDCIITNDYFELMPTHAKGKFISSNFISNRREIYFHNKLDDIDELAHFIDSIVKCIVYNFGVLIKIDFEKTDVLVPNADKIVNMKLKLIRFYA